MKFWYNEEMYYFLAEAFNAKLSRSEVHNSDKSMRIAKEACIFICRREMWCDQDSILGLVHII